MNFEKIEAAFQLLLENVQNLQNTLSTNFYDALIEQNILYLQDEPETRIVLENNQKLAALELTAKEWIKVYQFILMKAAQTEPLQANHQFTPDAIGLLMTYLIDVMGAEKKLDVLEIGSGTGLLAQTVLAYTTKQMDYFGLEVDDLLIDLSASIADVIGSEVHFAQGDAVRPQVLKESDVIISDLPVGYYPDQAIASRYEVASANELSYAHHLLMEQSLKYLKADGVAIFLAPSNLLTSPQSDLLKAWIQNHAQLLSVIALPDRLFGSADQAKSLFVFGKSDAAPRELFVYPIADIQDQETLLAFKENFQKWWLDSEK